ncbi:META domain-containing protein [Zoogloea sp.]|uniref:META domain-containing protein n=1 Tax=Zoogloea sp. TaxID=49181 RepID=UPI001415A2D7|nr:MAG: META domain-containing protein [Zoogloea sp.]
MRTTTLLLSLLAAPCIASGPSPTAPGDGIYVHLADSGRFVDCRSGKAVLVAQEADNAALERAYLHAAGTPGAPLWVSLLGHVEKRQRQEGPGTEERLVVERFARTQSSRGCTGVTELGNARWRLVSLGPWQLPPDETPPAFLSFLPGGRLAGSTGCNRIIGEYRSWGVAGLAVLNTATTRMACQSPAAEREAAVLDALRRSTHRIQAGTVLELLAEGIPLARFEAESLR